MLKSELKFIPHEGGVLGGGWVRGSEGGGGGEGVRGVGEEEDLRNLDQQQSAAGCRK